MVGNGFDLAHDLKTSYYDFIKDYLTNILKNVFSNQDYEDTLISIKHNVRVNYNSQNINYDDPFHILKHMRSNPHYSINYFSKFFQRTIERVSILKWVDLENEYFYSLLNRRAAGGGFNIQEVEKLNNQFEYIKQQIKTYLSKIELTQKPYTSVYCDLFTEEIKSEEVVIRNTSTHLPQQIMILNFNYTNTVEQYLKLAKLTVPTTINYIHGKLNTDSNPIIFGFGDEFDNQYLKIEELREKELLKHIKSFWYSRADNYFELIRFIQKDEFQVYVMGHSLGISDRTMLREIFEHNNCLSVKMFYHEKSNIETDFNDKIFDLAMHFTNNGLMRKKLVPYPLSRSMPQISMKK